MGNSPESVLVPKKLDGERLDRALAALYPEISRRKARSLISDGRVEINGKCSRISSRTVLTGTQIQILPDKDLQLALYAKFPPLEPVYMDKDVVVINKPPGMAVQQGRNTNLPFIGGWWLHHHLGELKVVHRLDVPASGLIILAKNRKAAAHLSEQFRNHIPRRIYAARLSGHLDQEPGEEITVNLALDKDRGIAIPSPQGKPAITRITVTQRNPLSDDIKAQPDTGRFHQIRAHLAHLNAPILGDKRYGGAPSTRMHLHACELTIDLPSGGQQRFESPAL